jgi:hypothetical protein
MWHQSSLPCFFLVLALSSHILIHVAAQCPLYQTYSNLRHEPFSTGRWNLSYMRPIEPCRTFVSHEVEDTIERLRNVIVDPDLLRVFENSWPSTLDTTIGWRGYANDSLNAGLNPDRDGESGDSGMQAGSSVEREELSFVITGDIEAMWLRDSANQLQAYVSLLQPSSSFDSLASLFRGAINLQARYILEAPFCNAFQAPFESLIPSKSSMNSDQIAPSYDFMKVFSCNLTPWPHFFNSRPITLSARTTSLFSLAGIGRVPYARFCILRRA